MVSCVCVCVCLCVCVCVCGGGAVAFSHLRRARNIKNGGMPMCFDARMRTLLRMYLQDLGAADRLVYIKVMMMMMIF